MKRGDRGLDDDKKVNEEAHGYALTKIQYSCAGFRTPRRYVAVFFPDHRSFSYKSPCRLPPHISIFIGILFTRPRLNILFFCWFLDESDHNTILLSLPWPTENPRGPDFWKFNNSVLEDKEYTTKILELYISSASRKISLFKWPTAVLGTD